MRTEDCEFCEGAGAVQVEGCGPVEICDECVAGHYLRGREEAREAEDRHWHEADAALERVAELEDDLEQWRDWSVGHLSRLTAKAVLWGGLLR